jgi:hypothetical protein
VGDRPPDCAALHDVAAELALGALDGPARGEALAHVAGCADCQAHLGGLTDAVDRLVATAPEAEPPPGFESAVIARIAKARAPERRPGGYRTRVLLAAAAVVLAVGGLAAGLLLADDATEGGGELATATMIAPDGDAVGEVWRYGDDDAALVVSVPAWAEVDAGGLRYALRLELADGETVEVGDFTLDGSSSWGTATSQDQPITSVSVVDETGHVWCTGEFA